MALVVDLKALPQTFPGEADKKRYENYLPRQQQSKCMLNMKYKMLNSQYMQFRLDHPFR